MTTEVDQLRLAKDAIRHVLNGIADDPRKYWLMGSGTESFAKLTAAASAFWNMPVEEVRASFQPRQLDYDRYCAQIEADQELLQYCRENGIVAKERV